jgi:hypothetical protein
MKNKITMTCILKSGHIVTDTIKFRRKDSARIHRAVESMRTDIERYMANPVEGKGQITFGHTTIAMSEIALVSFKD